MTILLKKREPGDRDELIEFVRSNVAALGDGLTLLDSDIGAGEHGRIDLLAAEPDGRPVIIDVAAGSGEDLLVLALAQASWLRTNAELLGRAFRADFTLSPRIVLIAAVFGDTLTAAAASVHLLRLELVECRCFDADGERAFSFEPVAVFEETRPAPESLPDEVTPDDANLTEQELAEFAALGRRMPELTG